MKRLFNTLVHAQMVERVSLLTRRGILTRTEAVGGRRNRFGPPDPHEWAVYVCLDRQFEDAVALLANPHHVVTDRVDVSWLDRVVREESRAAGRYSLTFLVLVTGALALVVLGVAAGLAMR